jgi:hypothetical protein
MIRSGGAICPFEGIRFFMSVCFFYYVWGDPDVDGRIILRSIFRKWDVGVWTGLSWLRKGTGGGHL